VALEDTLNRNVENNTDHFHFTEETLKMKTTYRSFTKRLSAGLAGALMLGLLITTQPSAESNLLIPESTFDFGLAPQKSKLTHVFWLKSTGDDSLIIDKIVPGCGCTKAPLDKSRIAPGDSARLEIIFDTRTSRSKVSKRPKIFVKGSDLPRSVQIMSTVMSNPDSARPVSATPYKLDISQFGEKARSAIEFTLTNSSNIAQRLEVIDLQSEFFDLELANSIQAGETISARLTVKESKLSQSFEKSLTLSITNERNEPPVRMTLPIKRTVRVLAAEHK
jgi:hypothetical protein